MSCCGCNRTPCVCVPQCPENCPEVIDYSFESINLAGVAVLNGVSGSTVQFRGIRSDNVAITVTHNAAMGTVDLDLDAASFPGTEVFANAAARGLNVPDFQGQFGVQIDTGVPYISTGTTAGDWSTHPMLILGADNANDPAGVDAITNVSLSGGTGVSRFTFSGFPAGNEGQVFFDNIALVRFDAVGEVQFGLGTTSTMESGAVLDFESGSEIHIDGSAILTSSLLGTSSTTAGELEQYPISGFVSSVNVASYVQPTGTASRAGFATYTAPTITNPPTQAEVQDIADALEIVSQHVKALLDDLAATLKPDY